MLNIPPRAQHSVSNTPQIKRRNKTTPNKKTGQSQTLKQRMERRHKQDRRQKQLRVSSERRKLSSRRKHGNLATPQSTSSADQINTVSLHINTSA